MRKAFVRLVPFLWFRLGLIHLWRLVPHDWRRWLGRGLLGAAAEEHSRLAAPSPPLLVCGLLRSTTGFGWVARSTLQLAKEAGVEAHPVDLSEVLARDNLAAASGYPALPRGVGRAPGTLIVHFNPNQFPYVRSFLPEGLFDQKYIIASCAWELERIPDSWVPWLGVVDELWLPSSFVAAAVENAGVQLPMRVVPPLLGAPDGIDGAREPFGFGGTEFLVFVAFSFGSGLSRKNPSAAIACFRAAFGADASARLVVKVSDVAASPDSWARFRDECSRDPQIVVISDHLDDRTMWELMAACDVVLSLHRAEGFGMVPAQGMLLGKAVVATGWSGNLDFMAADNSILVPCTMVPVEDPEGVFVGPGLRWAEPDLAAAASALRRLRSDPVRRDALGARGRRSIEAYLAERRAALLAHLRQIGTASAAEELETPFHKEAL